MQVSRAFWRLCGGMNSLDLARLWKSDDLRNLVYTYIPSTREVVHDPDVPWPVAFYLGSRSRRFIEMGNTGFAIPCFSRAVEQLCRKIEWASVLGDVPERPWWHVHVGSDTRHCWKHRPPEVVGFVSDLKRCLLSAGNLLVTMVLGGLGAGVTDWLVASTPGSG